MMSSEQAEAFHRLNATIDQTHADMVAFRSLPHGEERNRRFTAFLRGVEELDKQAYDYCLAHPNRVRKEGK